MIMDVASVSRWYVLIHGFKPYSQCPRCQSENILYFRVYRQGEAGILPECGDCHKSLVIRWKPHHSKRRGHQPKSEGEQTAENQVLSFN